MFVMGVNLRHIFLSQEVKDDQKAHKSTLTLNRMEQMNAMLNSTVTECPTLFLAGAGVSGMGIGHRGR